MKIVNVFVLHFVILLYINIVLMVFKIVLNEGINKNEYYTFHKFLFVWFFKSNFLPSGPNVPFSLPATDRECSIFGLTRQKNRILTMGANKESLRSHVCHPRLRLGWQFTCDLGYSLFLLPRCVIYYYSISYYCSFVILCVFFEKFVK